MTEYEKLVGSLTGSAEPEFEKYSDWSSKRPIEEEDTTSRVNYADYLRKTYIDAGAMSVKAEEEIQTGLYSSLVKEGSLEQGDLEGYKSLTAPKGISKEAKLDMIQSRISQDDPDWTTITEFKEANRMRTENPYSIEDDTFNELQLKSDEAVDRQYDVVKKRMLRAGDLPFIATTDAEGNRRIIAGDSALKFENLSDAIAASSAGDVSLSDAYIAQEQLVVPAGSNVPRFKLNRYNEAKGMINSLVDGSSKLGIQIEAHAKNLAESEDKGVMDWSKRRFEDVGEFFSGLFDSDAEERIDALDAAQEVDHSEAIRSIAEKLNNRSGLDQGEEYNAEEIEAAYNQIILEKATNSGMFEFYEGEEAGKNLRMTSFGTPVVHSAAMVNEDAFNDMLKARPDLSPETRQILEANRTAVLDQNFESYAKVLSRSGVDDEWNAALMQGRADGKANHKILNDFLANEDNYSEFTEKAAGVGASIIDGFGTLLAAVPAAMGNDVAIDYLAKSAQRSSDRREVARMFNQEYGYPQEIFETIVPMTVDIAATAILAGVTAPAAGVGGAAYVSARAGSFAAAKAITKGVISHTIKTAPKKITTLGFGKTKGSQTLAQVIEEAVKKGDGKLTNDVMKAFNSNLAEKIGTSSAVFVPAATRSGAATYGSITNHLRENTDLSEEEIRDRALGAGFMSAAITGVITSGFSLMGRGGLDDALLRGMSFRELKAVTERVSGFSQNIKNESLTKAIKKSISRSLSKNGKMARVFSVGKNFTDEAMEEGLDQFVNSFVEDAALDQDTPLLERLEQTFHAAMIGGIMGAGAPVVQKVGSRLKMNEQRKFAQVDRLYDEIAKDVELNLKDTGSPISAAVLGRYFRLSAKEAELQVSDKPAPEATQKTQPEVTPEIAPEATPEVAPEVAPEIAPEATQETEETSAKPSLLTGISELDALLTPLEGMPSNTSEDILDKSDAFKKVFFDWVSTKKDTVSPIEEVEDYEVELDPAAYFGAGSTSATNESKIFLTVTPNGQAHIKVIKPDGESGGVNKIGAGDLVNGRIKAIGDFKKVTPEEREQRRQQLVKDIEARKKAQQEEITEEVTEDDITKALNEADPEEVKAAADSALSGDKAGLYPKASKSFTPPPLDLSFFQKGKELTDSELQEANAVLELENAGYPVRLTSSQKHGVPLTRKDTSKVSDHLANRIYSKWPLIELDSKQKTQDFTGQRITYFDPVTQKKVSSKAIKGKLDTEGNGVFNNDPVLMAQMLAHNIRIPVPDSVNVFDINPSIRNGIVDGYVTRVEKPRADGLGVEHLGSPLNSIVNAKVDKSRLDDLTKLPFTVSGMEDTVMPHGATPVNERGYSLPVGDSLSTFGDIRNSLKDYTEAVTRSGEDFKMVKIHLNGAKKTGLDLLEKSDTGAATPIFEAYHEYLFLLNLFSVRDTLLKSTKYNFSAGDILAVPDKRARNFAAREIATRLSIDNMVENGKVNTKLLASALKGFVKVDERASNADIINEFVNQQILNNRSFANNAMPTFPSVLSKKVRKYVDQEKSRKMAQQNSVVSTFSDLNLDSEIFGDSLVGGMRTEGMTDLDGNRVEDPFAGSGPLDRDVDLSEASLGAKAASQLSVEEINDSPELRQSLEELFIDGIVPNASAKQIEEVKKMTTSDIMSVMGEFLRSANYESAEGSQALKFKKLLSDSALAGQESFRQAVYLNYLSNLDSSDPQFIAGLRSMLKESLGKDVSEKQAINFAKTINSGRLALYSRTHVSGQQKAIYEAENLQEIERLGLESQNPESVVKAIQTIAKTSDSESHRLVADLLLEDVNFIRQVSFEIAQIEADFAGKYSRLTDGSHSVLINTKTGNGLGLENALLEEYVHAFLNNIANLPLENLSPNQRSARTRLEGLFKLAEREYRKGNPNPYMEDAFENFDEFLAKFLLSPELQSLIKDLDPPKAQRGFFTRILEALVSMFRKVSKSEAATYTAALKDVIALSKSVARTQPVPISQVGAKVADEAMRAASENAKMYEFLGTVEAPVLATAQRPVDPQDANFASVISDYRQDTKDPKSDQREMEALILHLKSRMPYGMEVGMDVGTPSPAYAIANKIFINPSVIMANVADMDRIGARVYVESVASEEVVHVASWNSLTSREINNYIDRLSLDNFKEIAGEYYLNPAEKAAKIALLESSVEENLTPEQENAIRVLKRQLAEEKLRMHLQKVTRGFTTEEDVDFWSSDPSLLQMIARYFKGIFSRLAAMREMKGGSGALDSMLRKIHGEILLINAGFNTVTVDTPFNTDNPEATMAEFKRFMEIDVLGEAQDYGVAVDQAITLAASSLPADSINRIMRKARLAVIDGRTIVDVEDDDAEPVEVQNPNPITGMDHKGIKQSIENLSTDRQRISVDLLPDEKMKIKVTDPQRIDDKTDKEILLSSVDVSLLEDGELHIDLMNTPVENSKSKSFSAEFMLAVIADADANGIKQLTTIGGGDYQSVILKKAKTQILNFVGAEYGVDAQAALSKMLPDYSQSMVGYSTWMKTAFEPEFFEKETIIKHLGNVITSDTPSKVSNPRYGGEILDILQEPATKDVDQIRDRQLREALGEADLEADLEATFLREEFGVGPSEPQDVSEDAKAAYLNQLSDVDKQKVVNYAKNLLTDYYKESSRRAKDLLSTQPEGEFDLFKAVNGGTVAENKSAKRNWESSGTEANYVFDLTDGSPSLKAYFKGYTGKLLLQKKTNEKIAEAITDYRAEVKDSAPEDLQLVKDKYNDLVMDKDGEIGLDFPLFASSRNPNPVSSGDKYDFSMIPELLEIPQFEYKTYKSPEGVMSRIFQGDLGSPIRSMLDQRDEFKRGGIHILKSFHKKFNDVVEEDGIILDKSTLDTIAAAQGYNENSLVSNTFYVAKENEHRARVKVIEADDTLTSAEKKTQKAASKQTRDDEIDLKERTAIDARNLETSQALSDLAQMSPKLAALITSMRTQLIQPIQEKIKGAGISNELRVRIDQTGNFYITRSYRMFNDPTHAQKVREDPEYAKARAAAMVFFDKDVKDKAYAAALDDGKSRVEADDAAEAALRKAHAKAGTGSTHGERALDAFIQRYEGILSGTPTTTNRYSKIAKNFSKRKDLPPELREILGEYGAETGTDLIARTYATVSTIAAEQVFRSNIVKVGKDQGFIVDAKTYAADPSKYPDFIQMKSNANRNDPFANAYAEKSLVDDLADIINPSFANSGSSTAEQAVSKTASALQNLTGKSMLLKTLGSVGFYFRNILGNILFFGPANGMPLHKMGSTLVDTLKFSAQQWNNPDELNAVLSEYVTLGVFGDELRAGMIKELLDSGEGKKDFASRLNEILDEAPVVGKGKSFIAATEKKLTGLSASVDGAYKIAYYEHELSVLRKAKANHPNTKVGKMGDNELKRLAASNVKRTAQSLSQAPPLVRALSKSSYGMLFAPFIRFKAEVPRIVYNTYKLAKEEKASDNPDIVRRGKQRLRGLYTVLGGVSLAVPAALAALSGIGDEEDEALRKSMPSYLRGHSFYYWGKGKDLTSVDLTYLNPFSLVTDPFARAFESLSRGNFSGAVGAFVKGAIFDQYLDEQILAGAVNDTMNNENSTTGKPIWIPEVDGFGASVGKGLLYTLKTAYSPRILTDAVDAYEASGGDYNKFTDSPVGELVEGAYPVRFHSVDVEKQYRRFLREHQSRIRLVNDKKFILYSDKPMSDDDVMDVYNEEYEGRKKLNRELYRVGRGFESLGISAPKQVATMRQFGFGKDKSAMIIQGVMDRLTPNKGFMQNIIERGHSDRIAPLFEARDKEPRYFKLKD